MSNEVITPEIYNPADLNGGVVDPFPESEEAPDFDDLGDDTDKGLPPGKPVARPAVKPTAAVVTVARSVEKRIVATAKPKRAISLRTAFEVDEGEGRIEYHCTESFSRFNDFVNNSSTHLVVTVLTKRGLIKMGFDKKDIKKYSEYKG